MVNEHCTRLSRMTIEGEKNAKRQKLARMSLGAKCVVALASGVGIYFWLAKVERNRTPTPLHLPRWG